MGKPAPYGVGASGLPPVGDQANAVLSGTIGAIGPGKPFAILGPMNAVLWASITTTVTTTKGSANVTVASATGLSVGDNLDSVNVPAGATAQVISGTTVTLAFPPQTYPCTFSTVAAVLNIQGMTTDIRASLVGSTIFDRNFAAGTTVTGVGPGTTDLLLSAAPIANSPGAAQTVGVEFGLLTGNAIQVSGADANATFTGAATPFATTTVQLERSFDGGRKFLPCNSGGGGVIASYVYTNPIQLAFGEPEKAVLYRWNCIAYGGTANTTLNWRVSATGQASTTLSVPALM